MNSASERARVCERTEKYEEERKTDKQQVKPAGT